MDRRTLNFKPIIFLNEIMINIKKINLYMCQRNRRNNDSEISNNISTGFEVLT